MSINEVLTMQEQETIEHLRQVNDDLAEQLRKAHLTIDLYAKELKEKKQQNRVDFTLNEVYDLVVFMEDKGDLKDEQKAKMFLEKVVKEKLTLSQLMVEGIINEYEQRTLARMYERAAVRHWEVLQQNDYEESLDDEPTELDYAVSLGAQYPD